MIHQALTADSADRDLGPVNVAAAKADTARKF
jgi:hypothetical protein